MQLIMNKTNQYVQEKNSEFRLDKFISEGFGFFVTMLPEVNDFICPIKIVMGFNRKKIQNKFNLFDFH